MDVLGAFSGCVGMCWESSIGQWMCGYVLGVFNRTVDVGMCWRAFNRTVDVGMKNRRILSL